MMIDWPLQGKRCIQLLGRQVPENPALWRGQGTQYKQYFISGSPAVWAGASKKVTPLKRSG